MGTEKNITIKEAELVNNCPECFNQELKLSFYQKHTYNAFFHRTTPTVTHEIKCKTCYNIIYPVNWTEDIERVFDYYNKLVEPDKPAIRLTSLTLVLILVLVVLVAGGIYLLLAR
ncbi:hypothetical protein [Croceivirga radicis]|uniref:hypothetical protein n=1 Tax=Croceivirga radicis TaxID=1929488 RepID=UPI000255AE03|nr:hypothetical protein [Croceivirga radicis]